MAKKPRIQATVGPFTFAYPHLTAPDSEGTYADNKYKVDGVVDPTSPAGKAVQAEVSKALKALGLGKDAQLPLKKQTARTKRARRRSEEHTSELQSLMRISYAVFCLKNK